jgi:hypothetical protein
MKYKGFLAAQLIKWLISYLTVQNIKYTFGTAIKTLIKFYKLKNDTELQTSVFIVNSRIKSLHR